MQSQVRVASIFSNNMVLQRHVKIPVWGWANANEKIEVTFHNQKKNTTADATGKWTIHLDEEEAGGPFTLAIKGKNKIKVKNVLVGEVWICSGQSNMEWTVGQSDGAKNTIAKGKNRDIRHVKIPKEINSIPSSKTNKLTWNSCSQKTIDDFSGIGYFFAKELNQELKVPIGLINCSWGGTNIETWISRDGFESSDEFKEMMAQMPNVNLDTLLDLKMVTAQKRIETLQKTKIDPAKIPFFKQLDYDDTHWVTMQQPGIWEDQSLENFDGIVWLRKHFNLSKEDLNGPSMIEIPAIDDNDITYINGTKIGETKGWDIKRLYQIPTKILQIGDNVIAIRVVDNGGSGGIYGKAAALKLKTNSSEYPLSGAWKFQIEAIKNSVNENEFPSLCYNAMLNPLIPFAFKGVLWYQGESNPTRAFQYQKTFPLLIENWRSQWKSSFPFYFVQLATYRTVGNSNEGCSWAELREAQTKTLRIPNTAMVVTTDIGNPNDIHPTNKLEVGRRLSSIAFDQLYGKKMICTGPTFKAFENKNGQTTITFDAIGSGLKTADKTETIYGFEAAGEDHIFYPAIGKIVDSKVILNCEKVSNPIAIRYAWIGDASACNLFNKEGFPAVPFRTDDWSWSTEKAIYEIPKLVRQ